VGAIEDRGGEQGVEGEVEDDTRGRKKGKT